jgi:hypothetical protein
MSTRIEITHLIGEYSIHADAGRVDVHETLQQVYLNAAGLHVIYHKKTRQADVEISALLGADKAIEALNSTRKSLLELHKAGGAPAFPPSPIDLPNLALAIWTDLERAASASTVLHDTLVCDEAQRTEKAKWLSDLPDQTPLILLGTPKDFFTHHEDSVSRVGHVFILNTSKGAPALKWPDGSHFRDFRPKGFDNSAQLATRGALAAASEYDILLPDKMDVYCKSAEVISRLHGQGPTRAQIIPEIPNERIPTLQEWMEGFSEL